MINFSTIHRFIKLKIIYNGARTGKNFRYNIKLFEWRKNNICQNQADVRRFITKLLCDFQI